MDCRQSQAINIPGNRPSFNLSAPLSSHATQNPTAQYRYLHPTTTTADPTSHGSHPQDPQLGHPNALYLQPHQQTYSNITRSPADGRESVSPSFIPPLTPPTHAPTPAHTLQERKAPSILTSVAGNNLGYPHPRFMDPSLADCAPSIHPTGFVLPRPRDENDVSGYAPTVLQPANHEASHREMQPGHLNGYQIQPFFEGQYPHTYQFPDPVTHNQGQPPGAPHPDQEDHPGDLFSAEELVLLDAAFTIHQHPESKPSSNGHASPWLGNSQPAHSSEPPPATATVDRNQSQSYFGLSTSPGGPYTFGPNLSPFVGHSSYSPTGASVQAHERNGSLVPSVGSSAVATPNSFAGSGTPASAQSYFPLPNASTNHVDILQGIVTQAHMLLADPTRIGEDSVRGLVFSALALHGNNELAIDSVLEDVRFVYPPPRAGHGSRSSSADLAWSATPVPTPIAQNLSATPLPAHLANVHSQRTSGSALIVSAPPYFDRAGCIGPLSSIQGIAPNTYPGLVLDSFHGATRPVRFKRWDIVMKLGRGVGGGDTQTGMEALYRPTLYMIDGQPGGPYDLWPLKEYEPVSQGRLLSQKGVKFGLASQTGNIRYQTHFAKRTQHGAILAIKLENVHSQEMFWTDLFAIGGTQMETLENQRQARKKE